MHKLHRQHQQPHRNSLFPTFFPLRPSSRQSRSPFSGCPSELGALPFVIPELILFAPFPAASFPSLSAGSAPSRRQIPPPRTSVVPRAGLACAAPPPCPAYPLPRPPGSAHTAPAAPTETKSRRSTFSLPASTPIRAAAFPLPIGPCIFPA